MKASRNTSKQVIHSHHEVGESCHVSLTSRLVPSFSTDLFHLSLYTHRSSKDTRESLCTRPVTVMTKWNESGRCEIRETRAGQDGCIHKPQKDEEKVKDEPSPGKSGRYRGCTALRRVLFRCTSRAGQAKVTRTSRRGLLVLCSSRLRSTVGSEPTI